MDRTLKQIPVNETEYRYEVTITGENCPPKTIQARKSIRDLLATCLQTPGMLDCGMNQFESAKIYHDGEKWNIVLEAVGK